MTFVPEQKQGPSNDNTFQPINLNMPSSPPPIGVHGGMISPPPLLVPGLGHVYGGKAHHPNEIMQMTSCVDSIIGPDDYFSSFSVLSSLPFYANDGWAWLRPSFRRYCRPVFLSV